MISRGSHSFTTYTHEL